MGGLDCRRVVHITGRTYKVLSITTISTPHYGSPTADIVAEVLESTGRKYTKPNSQSLTSKLTNMPTSIRQRPARGRSTAFRLKEF